MTRKLRRQVLVNTYALGTGTVVLRDGEAWRLLKTEGCDDGSMDLHFEPEMDDMRVINVGYTYLSQPVWEVVAPMHCGGSTPHMWHTYGYDTEGGPFYCYGTTQQG